ncbi:MAG: hypothetical protein RMH97_05650, partial [Verrucomicrobiales bacterium]|nr:hypothetical protein [Verrucomicrobiales bacterium]
MIAQDMVLAWSGWGLFMGAVPQSARSQPCHNSAVTAENWFHALPRDCQSCPTTKFAAQNFCPRWDKNFDSATNAALWHIM